MAKYETELEETAEKLTRKQLGLDPKKKDVEKDKDLPQMLVSVKKTFLETLQNSFKKVCATVQDKSGVKDLSDDIVNIVNANPTNKFIYECYNCIYILICIHFFNFFKTIFLIYLWIFFFIY